MEGSRLRYPQSQDNEGPPHQESWSDPRPAKSRMEASIEDDKRAYSPYSSNLSRFESSTLQNRPWDKTLVHTARTIYLSIRKAPAEPTFLAVLTHGIVLVLFWYPTTTLYTCKQTHDPATWFTVLWSAFSCVELFFSGSVVRALYRHLASGKRVGLTGQFLLTLLVRSFPFPCLFLESQAWSYC